MQFLWWGASSLWLKTPISFGRISASKLSDVAVKAVVRSVAVPVWAQIVNMKIAQGARQCMLLKTALVQLRTKHVSCNLACISSVEGFTVVTGTHSLGCPGTASVANS